MALLIRIHPAPQFNDTIVDDHVQAAMRDPVLGPDDGVDLVVNGAIFSAGRVASTSCGLAETWPAESRPWHLSVISRGAGRGTAIISPKAALIALCIHDLAAISVALGMWRHAGITLAHTFLDTSDVIKIVTAVPQILHPLFRPVVVRVEGAGNEIVDGQCPPPDQHRPEHP